jgi:hypothetical protein
LSGGTKPRPLPLRRQLDVAVGRDRRVLLAVREQQLDDVATEPMLAQQRRRRDRSPCGLKSVTPKSMRLKK